MNYSVDNIHKICKEYGIENYTINSDGSIDVDGDVDLWSRGLTKLPMKFNNVSGDFNCHYNKLTTLLGSPQSVGGDFWCHGNKFITLDGSPERVGGSFYCNYNNLTTLEGGPQSVGGDFYYNVNPIYYKLGKIDYKSYIKQLNRDKILNELLNR
jgi:hypothetical protein